MFGDRRLRERELVHDMAAHPRFLAREHAQNPYPNRMGNRLGQAANSWSAAGPSRGPLTMSSSCAASSGVQHGSVGLWALIVYRRWTAIYMPSIFLNKNAWMVTCVLAPPDLRRAVG